MDPLLIHVIVPFKKNHVNIYKSLTDRNLMSNLAVPHCVLIYFHDVY